MTSPFGFSVLRWTFPTCCWPSDEPTARESTKLFGNQWCHTANTFCLFKWFWVNVWLWTKVVTKCFAKTPSYVISWLTVCVQGGGAVVRVKGGKKKRRSSKPVRALRYKQDDLAQLVFIANKHAKYKHPYAHVMSTKAHTDVYKHRGRWDFHTACLRNSCTRSEVK